MEEEEEEEEEEVGEVEEEEEDSKQDSCPGWDLLGLGSIGPRIYRTRDL